MEAIHSLRSSHLAAFQLLVILALWFSFLPRMDSVTVDRAEEVDALWKFMEANQPGPPEEGVQGYWITWNASDHNTCTWIGVTCTANYTVAELDFSGWLMGIGSLEALSVLRDLRRLDLSSNIYALGNTAIESIGTLTQLIRLDLSHTSINSVLSSGFFANTNLRFLDLEQTGLQGLVSDVISPAISNLMNLQFLNLAGNLLNGTFPTKELGGLSSLVSLDLSLNAFSGSISSLPYLTSLIELKLDDNNFTGFEEQWLLGTNRLEYLSVSNNKLLGKIPSSIGKIGTLSFLNMSGNYLSGKIPSGFSSAMENTFSLDLSHNQLTDEIPPDMLQSFHRRYPCSSVNLSYNLLTGNIPLGPNQFCFVDLNLANNNLSGPIPSNLFIQSFVSYLSLGNNKLSGDIVGALLESGLFESAYEARLENNLFTGDLSRILNIKDFTVVSLEILDLSNNHLQWSLSEAVPDPIQATLKVLTSGPYGPSLKEFRAGGNNFSGTFLPIECFLNNSNDNFDTNAFSVLDLSNSQLEGEIFGAAFDTTCLPSIQFLDLSNNHANGSVPESIVADRPLSPNFVLNISNNNLSGPLPVIPQTSNLYNPKYFTGNAGLCGDFLPPCPLPLPQTQGTGVHVQWWVLFIAIGGSLMIAMGSCLAVTWRWRSYHRRHQQDADLIKTLLERETATLMPLRELKKATENFAESAQIGEGGFGIVYIGKLDNGTMVAVKRSKNEGSEKDKEQFLNEVRILSQIKHRHLVKLLRCCMENKTAVLVFEFISNGTLQEHLQGKRGAARLSWKQRLGIAIQTADALNYLHSTTIFPIYHRDVKSANILLDDEFNAKVADFGISKLAPLQATHLSTVAVQGTIGYIDPEYYTSYQVTDKSDVYSFGVVLLELISARPALDFLRGGDETSLVYFSSPYIARGELVGLIDPALMETYCDEVGHGRKSILYVGELAMKCLEMRSKARPNMYEVLKELKKLWVDIGGTSDNHTKYPTDENDNNNLQHEHGGLLFDILSEESSSLAIESDASGIQLSQLSRPQSLRSRSQRG